MNSWPDTRLSLIGRLANPRDASAWGFFENSYQSAIYRYARSRGLKPDEAMDVVQEVMLAVHRQAMHWKPSGRVGSFRAWLSETARRSTLASIRFRSRCGQPHASESQVVDTNDESTVSNDDREWLFYSAVAEIEKETNPEHWQAFWMIAIEGKAAPRVALELGLKLGTVYSAKSRILARIRAWIEQHSTSTEKGGVA